MDSCLKNAKQSISFKIRMIFSRIIKQSPGCVHYCSNGKVSWQPGANEYHKVTSHNKPHTRDLLRRKKNRRMVASAPARNSRELNRIRPYTEFLGKGVELSRVEIGGFHVQRLSCYSVGGSRAQKLGYSVGETWPLEGLQLP